MGEWVLITGASGGIGEALAGVLASRGYDLALTARSQEKLARLAGALAERHKIRVETFPVDLSQPAGCSELLAALRAKGVEVDVLVNNAGIGTFGPFAEADPKKELSQIQLNVLAVTELTRELLPGMLARKRGRILNVASTAAFQSGPIMAVYYATKAYVLSFSGALSNELKGSGVTVTCLCPGPTRTGFMASADMGDPAVLAKSSWMMGPEEVARIGVDALLKGRRLVIPGFLNKVLAFSTRLGPRGLSAWVVRQMMKTIEGTRGSGGP